MYRLFSVLLPVILVGVILFVYQQARHNAFHFDDTQNILDAPAIHIKEMSWDSLTRVITESHLIQRPIPNITLAIDWWKDSGSPEPFQWTNLLIHCLVSLAAFIFLYTVITFNRREYISNTALVAVFIAVVIWSIHPIHVQAVTYIVQRMASLSALFMLLSVLFYLFGRRELTQKCWLYFFISFISALCAMLSKENAYVMPMLILLAEYGVVRNRGALIRGQWDKFLIGLPVIVIIFVVLDITTGLGPITSHYLPGYDTRDFTLTERLLTQPRVVFFHLSQIMWPLPARFSIEHDFAFSQGLFNPVSTLIAIAGALFWVLAGIWLIFREKARIYGFFMLWIPGTLVIESSVIPLEMVFEHRMYFPSLGLAGLLALSLERMMVLGVQIRSVTAIVTIGIAVFLAWSSMTRIPVWREQVLLYEDAVKHAPNSSRAWGNLGLYYFIAGDAEKAFPALQKSLTINPENPETLEPMGVLYMEQGRLDEAENYLQRVAMITAMTPSLHNHMGELAMKRLNYDTAKGHFQSAIRLEDWNPIYYWNLALSYELGGDCESGLKTWTQYLQVEFSIEDKQKVESHLRENYYSREGKCHQ